MSWCGAIRRWWKEDVFALLDMVVREEISARVAGRMSILVVGGGMAELLMNGVVRRCVGFVLGRGRERKRNGMA